MHVVRAREETKRRCEAVGYLTEGPRSEVNGLDGEESGSTAGGELCLRSLSHVAQKKLLAQRQCEEDGSIGRVKPCAFWLQLKHFPPTCRELVLLDVLLVTCWLLLRSPAKHTRSWFAAMPLPSRVSTAATFTVKNTTLPINKAMLG